MPTFSLVLFARTQNVQKISIAQDHIWLLKIKCSNCHQNFPKQIGVCRLDQIQTQKHHSHANFSAKCKNCERKGYITIVDPARYAAQPDQDGNVKGYQIIDSPLGDYFKVQVKGSDGFFQRADFTDLWCQYDQGISAVAQVKNQKLEVVRTKEK